MSSPLQLRLAALATIVALGAACSDSTAPSSDPPADLSQVLAELQPSLLASSLSMVSPVPAPNFSAPVPSSCGYDGVSKSFVCPNVTVSGVTASRSFTLFDASGAPQTAFDRTTTAAVQLKAAVAGTVTSGATTLVVGEQQDMTLSGLLTGVHTLNGTSALQMTGSYGTGATAIPIKTSVSTTIASLVLPKSSSGSQWPQSGTITASITDASFGSPMTVTIAFDGTSTAKMTVTVNGFTTTSTIDLANLGSIRR